VQHRLAELIEGQRPLVERNGRSDMEVVLDEILQGKVSIDFEKTNITKPAEALGRK
jgi:DNA-directed RNA polymerase subunit omega